MSILNQLYYNWYEMNSPYHPEDKEIAVRYEEAWRKSAAILGEPLSHELLGCILALSNAEALHAFCDGARFGAQLSAELRIPLEL